jgi:hypothetical protein
MLGPDKGLYEDITPLLPLLERKQLHHTTNHDDKTSVEQFVVNHC